jgi:uncharacterized OsmC-like protein
VRPSMAERYAVTVGAGSLAVDDGIAMEHAWTGAGATFDAPFTGAHLLHLSVAGCVLNDVYREAQQLGISVRGVQVTARGSFEPETWRSTGIEYDVALEAEADATQVDRLLARVDEVAEIPRALRHGVPVRRVHGG